MSLRNGMNRGPAFPAAQYNPPPPHFARPPPNNPVRRFDILSSDEPAAHPPPSYHPERRLDPRGSPRGPPLNDSYVLPATPRQGVPHFDRVRPPPTQQSNASQRLYDYNPTHNQMPQLSSFNESREYDRIRPQLPSPPPGLRYNDLRRSSPPPHGQDRREPPPLYEQDRRPLPTSSTPNTRSTFLQHENRRPPPPSTQNVRSTFPEHEDRRPPPPSTQNVRSNFPEHEDRRRPPSTQHMRSTFPDPREMPYEREPPSHYRLPHDYRNNTAPSPVPSMRSRPAVTNIVHEQENRLDFHNYFEAPPRTPRPPEPPMPNDDFYSQQRRGQESFNQEFQERNVISQPPPTSVHSIRGGYNGIVGSGRGGFNGVTNARGGFSGSGRGGTVVGNTRADFNIASNARGGFNDAPRNNRYDDRRNYDAPASTGYGGFQQLDAQSTNRTRAPRNYVPCNRNVEEIFNEDSEDVNRHANTIFDGDAEIEVLGEPVPQRCERWDDMHLDAQLLNNIQKSEYRRPRNIQQFVIPYIQEHYNIKCQSETGSGKTAAFLIPIVDNLIKEKREKNLPTDGPVCLIILPTRELAFQLYEQAKKFADGTGITVSYAYGQIDTAKNLHDIRRGCNILCATLGRLMDFVESSHITLNYVKYLVIDEADRLMDNREDNNGILKLLNYPQLPKKEDRQTCLFSATLKDPIVEQLADEYIDDFKQVFIIAKNESNVRIKYQILAVPTVPAKFRYLMEYLKEIAAENNECPRVLVFVNRKINVDRVAIDITNGGFPATTIHGERGQDLREEALASFKSGKTRCLVATDVCARGVDIKDMDYVINYDLPENRTGFVQRCGRTGRTHRGVAMSLYCEANDINMAQIIDGIINDAGQVSPEFLRNGVRDEDFVYEPKNNSSNRQEDDRSPSTVEPDSGFSRNNSPYDEQTNIADNDVDDGWN